MKFTLIIIFACAALLSHASANTESKTCPIEHKPVPGCRVEAIDPFPGQVSGIAAFEYDRTARNGPPNWHRLDCTNGHYAIFKKCSYCKNTCLGRRQSPIDIIRRQAVHAPSARAPRVHFVHNGHFEYEVTPGNFELLCMKEKKCGNTMYKNKKFYLHNVHMHHFSEHLLDAKQYEMEMHFVHKHREDILVVAVFFEVGNFNVQLENFLEIARKKCFGRIDLRKLVGTATQRKNLMTYSGSLTTPPCTEGVTFAVSQKVLTASNSQIAEFNDLIANGVDSRPRQPLNGRKVTLYS